MLVVAALPRSRAFTGRPSSLGQQEPAPYHNAIVRLNRDFPRCFTSREVLPTLAKAQQFARSANLDFFAPFATESGDAASFARQMDRKWWALEYWRKRLSTEPSVIYCPGQRAAQRSTDRWQIIQAVTGPYIIASGAVGARQVTERAMDELLDTLTFGISSGNPRWWLDINYLAPIALGVVALALYGRVRHARKVAPPQAPDSRPEDEREERV